MTWLARVEGNILAAEMSRPALSCDAFESKKSCYHCRSVKRALNEEREGFGPARSEHTEVGCQTLTRTFNFLTPSRGDIASSSRRDDLEPRILARCLVRSQSDGER